MNLFKYATLSAVLAMFSFSALAETTGDNKSSKSAFVNKIAETIQKNEMSKTSEESSEKTESDKTDKFQGFWASDWRSSIQIDKASDNIYSLELEMPGGADNGDQCNGIGVVKSGRLIPKEVKCYQYKYEGDKKVLVRSSDDGSLANHVIELRNGDLYIVDPQCTSEDKNECETLYRYQKSSYDADDDDDDTEEDEEE